MLNLVIFFIFSLLWLVLDTVHLDTVLKAIVYMDVKSIDVKVDVGKQFTIKHEFTIHEYIL